MEEKPGNKEPSDCESSSVNNSCDITRISSCSTPKTSADEDETIVSNAMSIECKQVMAIELKADMPASESKEEGSKNESKKMEDIKLKDEATTIHSVECKQVMAIELKEDMSASESKEEGSKPESKKMEDIKLKDEVTTIHQNLEENGAKTSLKEGIDLNLLENNADIKMDNENAMKLKKEGTRLFQKRDYEGAAFTFDKAIQLLPKEHGDRAFLHCNIAACYMHMVPEAYDRAVDECNSALVASPKYTNALLKRARCFEALDRLDLACIDVQSVLSLEPNNVTALELLESLKEEIEHGDELSEEHIDSLEEPSKSIFSKEKIVRRISRKFGKSIVHEEVWLIHDEDVQDNDEDSKEDNCNETNHIGNDLRKEESDTNEHNQDDTNRYTEGITLKHDQHKLEANDQDHLHNASDGMKEMQLKQKQPAENKHENNPKEIKVRGGQHEQEMHTKHSQVSMVEKHPKKTEDMPSTSTHRIHDGNHTEMYESCDGGNQEKHSLQSLIARGDPGKQIASNKPPYHGREKQKKSVGENRKDVTRGEMKPIKFVLADDIRIVVVPENCTLIQLTNIARLKYTPHLKAMHLKFKDLEGDFVTITSTEELRWVEDLNPQRPTRLYIKEVSPDREITREIIIPTNCAVSERNHSISEECGTSRHGDEKSSPYADDWIVQFARLFKNYVGLDCDTYIDLRDLGTRLYYEAMEETITSDEAQEIFQVAETKFQEMAAVALFNWGNVHMSRARKRIHLSEEASEESVLFQVKKAYEWACAEYIKAGKKFEDTVDVKPDFYEGLIALANQQFEQAKLAWRYADACKVDMGTEVLELFNHAEDNMEKGVEMWEGIEHLRIKGMKSKKEKILMDKLGLNVHLKDLAADEAVEEASNMRSQLNISWGTILYERSVVEFKLNLRWEESLTEAIEKFKTGGASLADISVMIKNHCANEKTQEGLIFKIDEIVQAWNEMYDAKKLKNSSSSFRLEPLFRRKPSKLHSILEHIQYP